MDDPRCPSPIAAAGPRMGLGSLGMFGAQGIPTDVALHMSLQLFNRGHADPAGRESAARSGSPPVPQSHPVSPGTEAGGCREGAGRRAGGARGVGGGTWCWKMGHLLQRCINTLGPVHTGDNAGMG